MNELQTKSINIWNLVVYLPGQKSCGIQVFIS